MEIVSLVAPGALAFVGSFAGDWLGRRTAQEQARSRDREETMRLLRWAADHAIEARTERRELGIGALAALMDSSLVDDEDVAFVESVFIAARATPSYDESEGGIG